MRRPSENRLLILICGITFSLASGCTLKASTESLTDTTTNFVSSTTPGASFFNEDGLLKPDQRFHVFVAMNYESLQQDMAKGEGEYLTALATLLEVPDKEIHSFKTFAQKQFLLTNRREKPTQEQLLIALMKHTTKGDSP